MNCNVYSAQNGTVLELLFYLLFVKYLSDYMLFNVCFVLIMISCMYVEESNNVKILQTLLFHDGNFFVN